MLVLLRRRLCQLTIGVVNKRTREEKSNRCFLVVLLCQHVFSGEEVEGMRSMCDRSLLLRKRSVDESLQVFFLWIPRINLGISNRSSRESNFMLEMVRSLSFRNELFTFRSIAVQSSAHFHSLVCTCFSSCRTTSTATREKMKISKSRIAAIISAVQNDLSMPGITVPIHNVWIRKFDKCVQREHKKK